MDNDIYFVEIYNQLYDELKKSKTKNNSSKNILDEFEIIDILDSTDSTNNEYNIDKLFNLLYARNAINEYSIDKLFNLLFTSNAINDFVFIDHIEEDNLEQIITQIIPKKKNVLIFNSITYILKIIESYEYKKRT
jgi:hypothetical protein